MILPGEFGIQRKEGVKVGMVAPFCVYGDNEVLQFGYLHAQRQEGTEKIFKEFQDVWGDPILHDHKIFVVE